MTITSLAPRLLLALVLVCTAAQAQQAQPATPADTYKPVTGQPGKDVVWVPTPDIVVDRMLQMAEVKSSDFVVDLGSGDGKIAIAAARNHGARAQGLEYNPQMVTLSNRIAREAQVTDKVSFQRADIFESDFSKASVITMYLMPHLNMRLRPKLFTMAPGTRVVSHSFGMGDWPADETARAGTGYVYLWRIPANASGAWHVTAPQLGSHAPQTVRFTQRFQMLEGDAVFGEISASVVRPHLSGQTLNFAARDGSGQMLQFSGRVAGDRITGSVVRGTAAAVPFEARRSEPPQPIIGANDTAGGS